MTTNSWVLWPSLVILNVTGPAVPVLEDSAIEKSFSVADTPPAVDPADDDELLDEVQATPPSIAIAAPTTVMRLMNRPMHPLLCMDLVRTWSRRQPTGGS